MIISQIKKYMLIGSGVVFVLALAVIVYLSIVSAKKDVTIAKNKATINQLNAVVTGEQKKSKKLEMTVEKRAERDVATQLHENKHRDSVKEIENAGEDIDTLRSVVRNMHM